MDSPSAPPLMNGPIVTAGYGRATVHTVSVRFTG
jgi:hypothetical protein